ncbi:c-type cytochrome [Luteolibacter yonseiensis]|uniref:C-type cytochrome n=1 Tax=Luteolibacter yonseiensis TaxID=1144680 RepID=A0A934VAP3_9BACT|nr:PVC-type heme-binding CxxCH protein [Luteolibacter yonseiensis]MBK1814584.1 c-type cytochrome [Luteolibacter yonseiensis]
MKTHFLKPLLVIASSGGLVLAQELKPPVIRAQADGLPPKEALANFTTYEGFHIVQSAAEPEVRQPVAMTIDERGRVWIAEAYEYPLRAEGDTGKDRILIFEDKDGDGVFDSRKVFTEGLNLVSGLEVGFGGVWVGAAPYLMFIPDADGDDKADGKPEVLLDGFGWHDTHETLNSFAWGPDGWLYGCHGVFTHSLVGKPGTAEKDRQPLNAGIWRFHPTKKVFEVFAQGTSNPWGIDFNDHGQAFVTACVIPHLFHVIQGARYQRQAGRHFDPHTYDDIKTCADHLHYIGDQWANSRDGSSSDFGGGHAHCGLSIYLGDNFPDEFRGKLFFNNLHGHRMNQEVLERKGSGFVGKHAPDFLFSNDKQHMGVSLRYGPDGGMFLTDWYDSQTCHNVNGEIWNRSNGRIYKISYGESKAVQVDLRECPDMQLAKYQLHKNEWFVRNSRRLLQERAEKGKLKDTSVVPYLEEIMTINPDPTRRLRALWTLHAIGADRPVRMAYWLQDENEYVRAWAVQFLTESKTVDAAAAGALQKLEAGEKSPVVRLYLASALQRMEPATRWDLAAALLSHGEDAGDQNLPLMIWYGVSDLVPLDQARALDLAVASEIPLVRRYILRRISESPEGRAAVMERVTKESGDFPADALSGIAMAVANEQQLDAPPSWIAASGRFEKLVGEGSRHDFELLATLFGDQRMADRFEKSLADVSVAKKTRTAALGNLLRMKNPKLPDLLMKLARDDRDDQRPEIIRALGMVPDERTVPYLVGLFPGLKPAEKEAAVQTLAGSQAGARALASGLADGSVKRGDISAFSARQMRNYNQPEITSAVEKYWGAISSGQGGDKTPEINTLAKALHPDILAKADLGKGRELFQATCFACHQLFGEGMKIGPDLTGSNRKDLKYLLENIIDPNALVGVDYQLQMITKKDGQMVTGLLREKTPTALTIAMLGGATVPVSVAEIEKQEVSTTSMMPEGLLANLSPEQRRDLIGYLQSPKQVPLPVEGEIVVGDDRINVAEVNRGSVQQQPMLSFKADTWSGNSQLWWKNGEKGDRLVLRFESPSAGVFDVHGVFGMAPDYGRFRILLNGKIALESIDLYNKDVVITTGEINLGKHEIKKGLNQLILEILPANPEATPGNMAGIDHLRLLPVK